MRVNYILNGRYRYINFPISVYDLKKNIQDPTLKLGNNDHTKWLSYLNHQNVNIFTLLHIFNRIDTYNDLQFDKLLALLSIAKPEDIGHVLAAVDAVETSALIRRLEVLVDNRLLTKEVSRQLADYTCIKADINDYVEYASEVKEFGLFETPYGYLLPIDYLSWRNNIDDLYTLHNLNKDDLWIEIQSEKNSDSLAVALPLDEEELDLHMSRITVDDDYSFTTRDEGTLFNYKTLPLLKPLLNKMNIYELNELIQDLNTLSYQDQDKIQYLLSYLNLDSIQTFYSLLNNLNKIQIKFRRTKINDCYYKNDKYIEVSPNVPFNLTFKEAVDK